MERYRRFRLSELLATLPRPNQNLRELLSKGLTSPSTLLSESAANTREISLWDREEIGDSAKV